MSKLSDHYPVDGGNDPDPAPDDETTEDTAPEPMGLQGALDSAHLYAEHVPTTPEQIEAAKKEEADTARRHAQIVLLVKAVDALAALVEMKRAGFGDEEWAVVLASEARVRTLYTAAFDRDLIARRA